jgi:ABC-type transport system involved in multi-copper enzyme maturation permease subunit
MMSKGTVDLLIVKPIHRPTLFAYKFVGGLLFTFINTTVIMVGVWLAIGVQTGTWINTLPLCILIYTFQFAIFYSVSALAAVLTRSTIVAILVSFLAWGVLFALGWLHWAVSVEPRARDKDRDAQTLQTPRQEAQGWFATTLDVINAVSPRYKELDWMTDKMIQSDLIQLRLPPEPDKDDTEAYEEYRQQKKHAQEIYKKQMKDLDRKYYGYSWAGGLIVSSLFIVAVLGLACWRFSARDY